MAMSHGFPQRPGVGSGSANGTSNSPDNGNRKAGRAPRWPGVFMIWDGMGLVAKRIEHVPHSEPSSVVLRSLNPEYDSYERLAEQGSASAVAPSGSPSGCKARWG